MPIRPATLFCALALSAGGAQAATLTLRFTGLEPRGAVLVALFSTEAGFRAGRPVATAEARVRSGRAVVTFRDIEAGDYAVKSFQDADGNGALTTGALGIPREPYAFSNNARGRFGPPGWAKASFVVPPGGAAQLISMD